MKNVLVIDASAMFREYLKEKLTDEKIGVEIADAQRDAVPKLLSILPDLVILNIANSVNDVLDFLNKKQSDPNGKKIPVIMAGPKIDHDEVSDLVQYGVIKYFTRPIKFDLFFESVGRVLRTAFAIDPTPSVLDMHLNKDIIFIEIAMGLNREKITLLKYRLIELIENNELHLPKIILMMSDLRLSYVDGLNMELLLQNITTDRRVLKRNIKILSFDPFIQSFIEGHPNYEGIQVSKDLSSVLNTLVGLAPSTSSDVQNLISDKILSISTDSDQGSMAMRFHSDTEEESENDELASGNLKIAIVDTDQTVLQYLKRLCETLGEVVLFSSCKTFIQELSNGKNKYTLAISGMFMPEVTGLDLLQYLVNKRIDLPVIIYSSIVQKEVIMQALKTGASSYLIKPQPQEVLTQKILEIVNANRE